MHLALVRDYQLAWDQWEADMRLAGRMQQASSTTVYAHMWAALSRWCVAESLALDQLTPQRLDDYLASRAAEAALSPRYAWRLLRLVERVVGHRSRRQRTRLNTAATELLARRPDIRYANAHDADPLPEHLSPVQARRLVEFLSAIRPRAGGSRTSPTPAWQDLRNRAAVAVQLGGGLTPGEIRALVLEDLSSERQARLGHPAVTQLRVAGSGSVPERHTPLAAWAGLLLGYWLAQRRELGIPGESVFPSTRSSGKTWGKVAQYESVKKVLAAAGIDALEGGSFRLRHTFALRQLRRGTPPEEVARWLGVSDPGVMARYQRTLGATPDVV